MPLQHQLLANYSSPLALPALRWRGEEPEHRVGPVRLKYLRIARVFREGAENGARGGRAPQSLNRVK
jgi:hypothetical protein